MVASVLIIAFATAIKIRDYNNIKSEVWFCIFSFIVKFLLVMIHYCFFLLM